MTLRIENSRCTRFIFGALFLLLSFEIEAQQIDNNHIVQSQQVFQNILFRAESDLGKEFATFSAQLKSKYIDAEWIMDRPFGILFPRLANIQLKLQSIDKYKFIQIPSLTEKDLEYSMNLLPVESHDVSWLSRQFWKRVREIQSLGVLVALIPLGSTELVDGVYFPSENLIAIRPLFGLISIEHEFRHARQYRANNGNLVNPESVEEGNLNCIGTINKNYRELDALAEQMKAFAKWVPVFKDACLKSSRNNISANFQNGKPKFFSSFIQYVLSSYESIAKSQCPISIISTGNRLQKYTIPNMEKSHSLLVDTISLCENLTSQNSDTHEFDQKIASQFLVKLTEFHSLVMDSSSRLNYANSIFAKATREIFRK